MGLCCSSENALPNPSQIDLTHFMLGKVVGKGGFGKVHAVSQLDPVTGKLIDERVFLALKRMEKLRVVQTQSHLNAVWIERKIMPKFGHVPFLTSLKYAFQTDAEIFLVMPFLQGGDLRYHLSKNRDTFHLNVKNVQFYAAEMLLAMLDLHKRRILYRDLKPDNILLDASGHICLIDFGLAALLKPSNNYESSSKAGTPGYQSPEVIKGEKYSVDADMYSYGIVIYELLHGCRPFNEIQHCQDVGLDSSLGSSVLNNIVATQSEPAEMPYDNIRLSSRLPATTKDFLKNLLITDKDKRLGCKNHNNYNMEFEYGWNEIKSHPFFDGINFDEVYEKKIKPPFVPNTSEANCSGSADLADQLMDLKPKPLQSDHQKYFEDWEYNVKLIDKENKNINNDNDNNNNEVKNNDNNNNNDNSSSSNSEVPQGVNIENPPSPDLQSKRLSTVHSDIDQTRV